MRVKVDVEEEVASTKSLKLSEDVLLAKVFQKVNSVLTFVSHVEVGPV